MLAQPPSAHFIGDARRPEFAPAFGWLAHTIDVRIFRDIEQSIVEIQHSGLPPAVCVLATAYPGQFPGESVARLRAVAPLAVIVGMLGSWCEGETRTGTPWPGVYRVYAHQFVDRMGAEGLSAVGNGKGVWSWPATADELQRCLDRARHRPAVPQGPVMLISRSRSLAAALLDTFQAIGCAAMAICPGQRLDVCGATAVVYDADRDSGQRAADVDWWMAHIGDVPVVALVDFPRLHDGDQWARLPVAGIVSKPFVVDDLFWRLTTLQRFAAGQRESAA